MDMVVMVVVMVMVGLWVANSRIRFACSMVYFVNYGWDNLIVLYLEFLDLPLKNVVEGSTKYAFFKSFSTLVQSYQSFLHILI